MAKHRTAICKGCGSTFVKQFGFGYVIKEYCSRECYEDLKVDESSQNRADDELEKKK